MNNVRLPYTTSPYEPYTRPYTGVGHGGASGGGSFGINTTVSTTVSTHEIRGELLKVEEVYIRDIFNQIEDVEIKRRLAGQFVEFMLAKGMIEYTKAAEQPGRITVRARIFVTPNDQIRLLRENKYIP